MPAGFAGDLQRAEVATIETQLISTAAPPTAFGVAVKYVSGAVQPINLATDTAASVVGINLRPYPIQGNGTDPLGTSTPPTSGVTDVLKRGYAMVALGGVAAAAKGGTVYVRVGNVSAGKVLGDFEAAPDIAAVGVAGSNTGNGTIGTLSATSAATPGAFKVTFTAATAFNVTDPNGIALKAGATGAAYTAEGLTFTITAGGTAFVAGDSFTVTVTQNTIVMPSNWYFTGPADAYGITEIAANI
ncbi:hypothetical protein NDK50_07940 [Paraburkholderia bryophila]|uniref:gp53 minor capsid family protein n=1 Tax=Paraburkholderia bryophila TaxID=420952 RepID=UPI0023491035|nr:hypothetical protein [Paraburkholderia bryophila]WCM21367.1 hypothetical protein NDK50_07940 [Paraburkholderia bryophila]